MAAPDPVDYYELLGVQENADSEAITKAILDQRRTWVRRQNAPSVERQREAEDKLHAIAAAEAELLDADRRAAYDRSRKARLAAPPPQLVKPGAAPYPPPQSTPPPPPPGPPPTEWLAESTEALRRGDMRTARYWAKHAIDRNARDARAWVILGKVSKVQGKLEDAVVEFGEASRHAPSVDSYSELAGVNEELGYVNEAAAAYQAAATLEPLMPAPTIALANFWVRQSEANRAVEILTPVLQRNPADSTVANALGFAMLYRVESYLTRLQNGTSVFTSAPQVEQARNDLNYTLSLAVDDGDLLGRLRARLDQAGEAELRVWSFPPGNAGGRTVGWILLLLVALALLGIDAQPAGALLGIAMAALIVWGFVRIYRKPGYARNAAQLGPYVARWGI